MCFFLIKHGLAQFPNTPKTLTTVKSGVQYLEILQQEICYGEDFG